MLWYSSDPGRFAGQPGTYRVGRTGVPVRDNLRVFESMRQGVIAVAERALDPFQDCVDAATHDPWPGSTRSPRPFAEVRDSTLFWGSGDPSDAVLSCEPVPLPGIDWAKPAKRTDRRCTGAPVFPDWCQRTQYVD
jgi:hypothetical protein